MFVATIKSLRNFDETHRRLRLLWRLGFRAFRVNFARRTEEENVDLVFACAELGREAPCTVMVDLPGPKVRLGRFVRGVQNLQTGTEFRITSASDVEGNSQWCGVSNAEWLRSLQTGDVLRVADGRCELRVTSCHEQGVTCVVELGGRVHNLCGIMVHGRYSPYAALCSRDVDVLSVLPECIDMICPSFSDGMEIVEQVAEHVGSWDRRPRIIAKIESPAGVQKVEDIAQVSDGLMVCRGDLSTFYSAEEIVDIGEKVHSAATAAGKTIVYATGYFRSMRDGGSLSAADYFALRSVLCRRPDYVVIDETSSASSWHAIAETAMRLQMETFGGGVEPA